MIDTDKMRAAYATQPLCQREWTKKDGNNPTMLCAISALVAFAGVQPDLIHKMQEVLPGGFNGFGGINGWLGVLAVPVLHAEYGMPEEVFREIPKLFDQQPNEWRGVQAVLDLCERHNMDEHHLEAIAEDAARFPRLGFEHKRSTICTLLGIDYSFDDLLIHAAYQPTTKKPKGDTKTGQSKFWTAKRSIAIPKELAIK